MGFGPVMDNMFDTLMAGTSSRVLMNGFLSEEFQVNNGVRQGCPVAPLLFIIAMEPLARHILKNNAIQGIKIDDLVTGEEKTIKVKTYADDTVIYAKDPQDISEIEKELDTFKKFSNLKNNTHKSHLLPMGNAINRILTDQERQGYTLVKNTDSVKSLGLSITSMGSDKITWENVTKKFTKNIKEWKKHNLTLKGRVNIGRSHIASTVWYYLSSLIWSEADMNNLNDRYWRFIQKNGGDEPEIKASCTNLSKTILIQPTSKGGLNAMDMKIQLKALHAHWIVKMLRNPNKDAFTIPKNHIQGQLELGLLSLLSSYPTTFKEDIPFTRSKWISYLNLLKDSHYKIREPTLSYEAIYNEPLWGNPKYNKTVRRNALTDIIIKKGVTKVGQLWKYQQVLNPHVEKLQELKAQYQLTTGEIAHVRKTLKLLPQTWVDVMNNMTTSAKQVGDWFILITDCMPVSRVFQIENTWTLANDPFVSAAEFKVQNAKIIGGKIARTTIHAGYAHKVQVSTAGIHPILKLTEHEPLSQAKRIFWNINNKEVNLDSITVTDFVKIFKKQVKCVKLDKRVHNWNKQSFHPQITIPIFQKALKRLDNPYVSHKGKEIIYKTIHQAFFVGAQAKHMPPRALPANSPDANSDNEAEEEEPPPETGKCVFCNEEETNVHCIFLCPQAQTIWTKIINFFKGTERQKLLNANPWSRIEGKLFSDKGTNVTWNIIAAETARAIWWRRTTAKYKKKTLTKIFLINHIIVKAQMQIRMYMRTLDQQKKYKEFSKYMGLITNKLKLCKIRKNQIIIEKE
jgi:hypothetical protein